MGPCSSFTESLTHKCSDITDLGVITRPFRWGVDCTCTKGVAYAEVRRIMKDLVREKDVTPPQNKYSNVLTDAVVLLKILLEQTISYKTA